MTIQRCLEIQGLPSASPMNDLNSTEMLWGKSTLFAQIINAMVARLFANNLRFLLGFS